jgi:hypothetical protein
MDVEFMKANDKFIVKVIIEFLGMGLSQWFNLFTTRIMVDGMLSGKSIVRSSDSKTIVLI